MFAESASAVTTDTLALKICSESENNSKDRASKAARFERAMKFEELSSRVMDKIFHTVFRITRNREDAEDAVQDSMHSALVHFDDFDGRSSFSTWLTRIAINSALMILRKRRTSRMVYLDAPSEPEEDVYLQVADPAPDPEQNYLQEEREQTVKAAVRSLRPSVRRAVQLQQLEERPLKEAAKLMGISVAATKGRLFHGKAALRRSYKLKMLNRRRGYQTLGAFAGARRLANA
jgi:RNA polymerase sigma factor (sigma-70 family)